MESEASTMIQVSLTHMDIDALVLLFDFKCNNIWFWKFQDYRLDGWLVCSHYDLEIILRDREVDNHAVVCGNVYQVIKPMLNIGTINNSRAYVFGKDILLSFHHNVGFRS